LTTQVQDDGFHEIQLNGKQLVFLFMAATVVSVVIFLCGVLVGRGVKAERAAPIQNEAGGVDVPGPPPPAPVQAANTDLTATPPIPADEPVTYPQRLEETSKSKKETLKPSAPRTNAAAPAPTSPAVAPRPVEAPPPPSPAPKAVAAAKSKESELPAPPAPGSAAAASSAAAPHGDGYAIQVAALRESGEADTIAKRLVNKGYDAYVLTPPGGTPNVYRVRVGSFKTRRDAEAIASKLQQEEQFKPWITR
jgi:cell division septation protein DedD